MKKIAQNIVSRKSFEYTIIGLIIFNGVILGMETSPTIVANYGEILLLMNNIILAVFVIEALLKTKIARAPPEGTTVFR